jgi:hypothetical protein
MAPMATDSLTTLRVALSNQYSRKSGRPSVSIVDVYHSVSDWESGGA